MRLEDDNPPASRQTLKKIVIPSTSSPTGGSSLSSVRDQSSEYETPGTSVAVTPAESLVKGGRSHLRSGKGSSAVISKEATQSVSKGKRKRTESDDVMDVDELLAQALQEEEYEEMPKNSKSMRVPIGKTVDSDSDKELHFKSGRPPKSQMKNSDDDDMALFDDSEAAADDLNSDQGPSATRQQMSRNKRKKTRNGLPCRAASDKAKESTRIKLDQVMDSEDDENSALSDVSVFTVDAAESDFLEDSEYDEEDQDTAVGSNAIATIGNVGEAIAPVGRRRNRRGMIPLRSSLCLSTPRIVRLNGL